MTRLDYRRMASAIRGLAIDAVENAGHGHPGAAMGMADIATALVCNHLRFDASAPRWDDRERLVLSNGHASILHYALLYLTGAPEMTLEQVKSFRKAGSITPGHPEVGHTPGIEVTTGPLGQGLGMAVGLALAERRLRDEFTADICNHRTWVFAGDGCLMEGVGQEAASLAGHLGLGHLNVLYDSNNITIDGDTNLSFTEDTSAKFQAMGWHVLEACGHTHSEIDDALASAVAETRKPTLIIFRTTIGFGAPTKSGTSGIHGSRLGTEEAAAAKAALDLPSEPFVIEPDTLEMWRATGLKRKAQHDAWRARRNELSPDFADAYARRMDWKTPGGFAAKLQDKKAKWAENPPTVATRKASQLALEVLTDLLPEMIGGSADLTGSNLTKTPATDRAFSAASSGRYINYGVREFAMGAAMNGIALHGGFIPYGGTFLVFSDYMRNAIRLAALMKARTLFVMTHDSIGLGEDGPTHQPVEHLASLRAIPDLNLFRPADLVETLECYEAALAFDGPSLFAFSRQAVPQVRKRRIEENLSARGAYVITEPKGERDITLIATGTEVSIALEAATHLSENNINAAVVSMPCWRLFEQQPYNHRADTLGHAPRLALEAASSFGWDRYTGADGRFIGVDRFGASASAKELYEEFGLTAANVTRQAMAMLGHSGD